MELSPIEMGKLILSVLNLKYLLDTQMSYHIVADMTLEFRREVQKRKYKIGSTNV